MLPRLQAPPTCLKTSSPAWESQELVGLRLSELWMGEREREEEGGAFIVRVRYFRGGIFR
jgi:hypothetical protein